MTKDVCEEVLVLSKRCNQEIIPVVRWKNIHEEVVGNDIDLFVPVENFSKFKTLLDELSYKEFRSELSQFPSVFHFYKLQSDDFVHLNVYTRFVTGESQTKFYDLVYQDGVARSMRVGYDFRRFEYDFQYKIIKDRLCIKMSGFFSFVKTYLDFADYKHELSYLFRMSPELEEVRKEDVFVKFLMSDSFFNRHLLSVLVAAAACKAKLFTYARFGFIYRVYFRFFTIIRRGLNKLFFHRKKASVNGGLVVAFAGVDGIGKTTTIENMSSLFGRHFDVSTLHYGRPIQTRLVGKKNKAGHEVTTCRTDLVYVLKSVLLSYLRYRTLRKASRLRDKGYIVFLDRYPSKNYLKMDSPRLYPEFSDGYMYTIFSRLESFLYNHSPQCDLLVKLELPLELAISRNRLRKKENKEDDQEIKNRYNENNNLIYEASSIMVFDLSGTEEESLKKLSSILWQYI